MFIEWKIYIYEGSSKLTTDSLGSDQESLTLETPLPRSTGVHRCYTNLPFLDFHWLYNAKLAVFDSNLQEVKLSIWKDMV